MNELSSNPLLLSPAIVSITITGGLWRRCFGGWLCLSRVMLLSLSIIAASGMAYLHYGLDWRVVIVALCWAWLWSDGHQFAPPGKEMFYRYAAPMAVCGAVIGNPWLVLIGPGIFGAYWLSAKYAPEWQCGGFIDGVYAYAELGAGAWAFGVLSAIMALLP